MAAKPAREFAAIPVRGGDAYIFTLPRGTSPKACARFARRFERAFGHMTPGPVAFVVTEDIGVRWIEHLAMEAVAQVVDAWRAENAAAQAEQQQAEQSADEGDRGAPLE